MNWILHKTTEFQWCWKTNKLQRLRCLDEALRFISPNKNIKIQIYPMQCMYFSVITVDPSAILSCAVLAQVFSYPIIIRFVNYCDIERKFYAAFLQYHFHRGWKRRSLSVSSHIAASSWWSNGSLLSGLSWLRWKKIIKLTITRHLVDSPCVTTMKTMWQNLFSTLKTKSDLDVLQRLVFLFYERFLYG